MKGLFVYIPLGIIFTVIFAQLAYPYEEKRPPTLIGVVNPTDLYIGYWDNGDMQQVDTTFLEVEYDLKYRRETVTGIYFDMLTVLQIGSVKQKYYSMIRQLTDDIQADVSNQINGKPAALGIGAEHKYTKEENLIIQTAGVDWLNSEIWIDMSTHKLRERTHDYRKENLSLEYEEPRPILEWQFRESTDTICGYPCFTATTTFRGREWMVWYTPEIPSDAGPWKFSGLPGLILQAQDSQQDFIWKCRRISQKTTPIIYYNVNCILFSREKWRKYLRQIHEAPLGMLGENGMYELYVRGKLVTPEDNWSIPYNPIERE